jgi:hypothetical protein
LALVGNLAVLRQRCPKATPHEEETAELRKENEEVLGRDNDHQEAYDEEPASTDDDDRGSDGGDDRDAIMDFYEPATPSEEDPEEVEPHVSVD